MSLSCPCVCGFVGSYIKTNVSMVTLIPHVSLCTYICEYTLPVLVNKLPSRPVLECLRAYICLKTLKAGVEIDVKTYLVIQC